MSNGTYANPPAAGSDLTFDKLLETVRQLNEGHDRDLMTILQREAKAKGVTLGFDGYAVVRTGTFRVPPDREICEVIETDHVKPDDVYIIGPLKPLGFGLMSFDISS